MPLRKDYDAQDCAMARALEVVGERWTLLVLRDCFLGVRRFTDFRAHLDIPRAVLASRLADLVAAGVLSHDGRGYTLTARGEALWPVLHALAMWGEASPEAPRRRYAHQPCGADLDRTGRCPACGEVAPPGEVEVRSGEGADASLRSDPVSAALREPHLLMTALVTDRERTDRSR